MITFGELRKKSVEWQMELSAVERVYALDWLLKGVFDRPALFGALALTGAAALSKAHLPGYPPVEDLDFVVADNLDTAMLETELTQAAQDAARATGLQFRLHSIQPTEARVEFTGPLGRRSAAQPLIPLRFVKRARRLEPVARPLIHPFGDECAATVRAVALEELAAERIVLWSRTPRARDVYDLWVILTRGQDALDMAQTHALVDSMAREKRVVLRTDLDPAYAPLLERAWENALKGIRGHPAFAAARAEIEAQLPLVLGHESGET